MSICFDPKVFKLPINGIRNQYENPKNLFER